VRSEGTRYFFLSKSPILALGDFSTMTGTLSGYFLLIFSPSALLFSKGCSSLYCHFILVCLCCGVAGCLTTKASWPPSAKPSFTAQLINFPTRAVCYSVVVGAERPWRNKRAVLGGLAASRSWLELDSQSADICMWLIAQWFKDALIIFSRCF